MARQRNVPLLTAVAATIAALGLLAVHLWSHPLPGLDKLEGFTVDARFKQRGERAPTSDQTALISQSKTATNLPTSCSSSMMLSSL